MGSKDLFRIQLIGLVEMEPSIWDFSHDDYRLQDRRKNAWDRVVLGLRLKGHDCNLTEVRNVWKNLRDLWKKKQKPTTGSPATKDWIFSDAMKFLENCEFHGRTVSNLDRQGNFLSRPSAMENEGEDCESVAGTMKTKKPRLEDDTRQRIREATETVKAYAEGLGKDSEKKEDEYMHFGHFIGLHLKRMEPSIAQNKMQMLSLVLLSDVSIVLNCSGGQQLALSFGGKSAEAPCTENVDVNEDRRYA